VCDTLHGVGLLGRGSLFRGKWSASRCCVLPGSPPWATLQKFRPRRTGCLLELTAVTVDMFVALLLNNRPTGFTGRILVGVSYDMSAGSGEAAFRCVEHLVQGVLEKRIVGASTGADGRATFLNVEDARRMCDVASQQSSTAFETILLFDCLNNSKLKDGFIAGLLPVCAETSELLEAVLRRARALLLLKKVELVLYSSDCGAPNKRALNSLKQNAPRELPARPLWETGPWPPTLEELESPTWNLLPVLCCFDLVEHWLKHAIYAFYNYTAVLGTGPRDSFEFSELLYGLLGAKVVGGHRLCSLPGDVELCTLRGRPLAEHFNGDHERAKQVHRSLRLEHHIGVQHLEVRDKQLTSPAIAVAMCHDIFDDCGEKTLAKYCKAAATIYMSARGLDVNGKRSTMRSCLAADREALETLRGFNDFMNREGNGHDGKLKRKRGAWTPDTWFAVECTVKDWARFVEMCVGVGVDAEEVRRDKISSRLNEMLHSRLKQGGNAFLDVQQTLDIGERQQQAHLLRADTLQPQINTRRTNKPYSLAVVAIEKAMEITSNEPTRWNQAPLIDLERRKSLSGSKPTLKPTEEEVAAAAAESEFMREKAVQLTDKSNSSKINASWRSTIAKGFSSRRKDSKSKKNALAVLCESPGTLQRQKAQTMQFVIELKIVRCFCTGRAAQYNRDVAINRTAQMWVAPGPGTMSLVFQSGLLGDDGATTRGILSHINLSDVIGLRFYCDANTGVSSEMCVEITFTVLVESHPVIVSMTPSHGDYLAISHLFNTAGLKPVIATSAFVEDSAPAPRVRSLAAAAALLLSCAEEPAARADVSPDPTDLAESLGPGWCSIPGTDLEQIPGVQRVRDYVSGTLARGGVPPLRTFQREFAELQLSTRVLASMPAAASGPLPFVIKIDDQIASFFDEGLDELVAANDPLHDQGPEPTIEVPTRASKLVAADYPLHDQGAEPTIEVPTRASKRQKCSTQRDTNFEY
jgi:hypothetical protein